MKFIKTIENLLEKAENKGQAILNGRYFDGYSRVSLKKNMQLRLRVTHWL